MMGPDIKRTGKNLGIKYFLYDPDIDETGPLGLMENIK